MLRYAIPVACALLGLTAVQANAQLLFGSQNSCAWMQNMTMMPACLGSSALCIKSVPCKFNNKRGKACVQYVCNPRLPKTRPKA